MKNTAWTREPWTCTSCQRVMNRGGKAAHLPWCMKAADYFWSKVDRTGDCWLWKGTKYRAGYGHAVYLGRHMQAHRAAWIVANGEPGEMRVCHRCDNPPCVNPAHLFLGTDADNMMDKVKKHRDPRLLPADKVQAVRERLGKISQLEIAKELGLSTTVVSKIKLGKRYSWLSPTTQEKP